jgi:ATP-dependent DNA ligase
MEFPGDTFGHVHRFPTVVTKGIQKKDGTHNTQKWTIYCGVVASKINNKTMTVLNGKTGDDIIKGFAAHTNKIKPEYFNGSMIPIIGYTVVDSHTLTADGDDGARFLVMSFVEKGKNLTKVNRTNPFTQAMSEALSKFNKKQEGVLCLPMLADGSAFPTETAREHITELADGRDFALQYKYDGVRMIVNSELTYSRSGKPLSVSAKMRAELDRLLAVSPPGNIHFDGELYKHGVPLSEISGAARNANDNDLEYWIYDVFFVEKSTPTDMVNRYSILEEIFDANEFVYLKLAPILYKGNMLTQSNQRVVEKIYTSALGNGYEGLIMRYNTAYNNKNRKSMHKLKELFTEEFRVVGFTQGVGKMAKTILYECELTAESMKSAREYLASKNKTWTEKGNRFTVSPMGSLDDRKAMFRKMHSYEDDGRKHFDVFYLNRLYTVQFNNWSKFLIPMCPVGVEFRAF